MQLSRCFLSRSSRLLGLQGWICLIVFSASTAVAQTATFIQPNTPRGTPVLGELRPADTVLFASSKNPIHYTEWRASYDEKGIFVEVLDTGSFMPPPPKTVWSPPNGETVIRIYPKRSKPGTPRATASFVVLTNRNAYVITLAPGGNQMPN